MAYKNGLYQLTWTKAMYWFGNRKFPVECAKDTTDVMEIFACMLRRRGLEVVHVHSAFLEVDALEFQIRAALRNKS